MFVKILIVLMLLLIIGSLGLALRHLLVEGEKSPRTVKALTVRIGLSIALFFLLLLGYWAGLLHPHGLRTGANPPQTGSEQK